MAALPEDPEPSSGIPVDELLGAVYAELRNVARMRLARQPPGNTLSATALVHEVWLRMKGSGSVRWRSRSDFFAAAAVLMRNVLVDRAREKSTKKRGGDQKRSDLTPGQLSAPMPSADLLALREALVDLEREDPRSARLVALRFFVGMTIEEAAQVLEVSARTARSDWTFARTWLYDRVGSEEKSADRPPVRGADSE
jgi:RNA polymerase sigma factor (TIGR02999 family)